jgi:hypothetical protein
MSSATVACEGNGPTVVMVDLPVGLAFHDGFPDR